MCRTLTIVYEILYFLPFGRPHSGSVIIQLMTELDVSNNLIPERQYQNRLERKTMGLFLRLCHKAHILKKITDSSLNMPCVGFLSSTLHALCIETKRNL